MPGCIRKIKPALILENLVHIDGNRSGKALGLSRAWMMRWRGAGRDLKSLSSARFRLKPGLCHFTKAASDGNAEQKEMAGSRKPAGGEAAANLV